MSVARALPFALGAGAAWLIVVSSPALAAVEWENVADEVGVDFQQAGEIHGGLFVENPDEGFPELIGSGACMADLDGDGYDDLFLVSQQYNPENQWTEPWADDLDMHNKLFVNEGDGTFRDASIGSGLESRAWGYGCSAGDYDDDGDLDVFLANFGPNELFRNDGDLRFTNVTVESGVGMNGACGEFRCMSTNSAWGDYDLDGDLDLYVANYVDTDLSDYDHGPNLHAAQLNFLHRNNGDGTFTELGIEAGVAGSIDVENGSKSFAAVWFDHDLDGDLDLFVANDMTDDDLYENNGDGTFEDRSDASGLADPRAGMGLAIADYDGDAFPDVFITHYQGQEYGFYHNRGDGTYEDRSGEDDLHEAFPLVGWGTQFVDIERDGDLDLIAVMGHTAAIVDDYNQSIKVWRQDPNPDPEALAWDRVWVDVSDESGPGIAAERVHRGASFGDVDLDGDTDILTNQNANQTAQWLEASGVENHWLNVRVTQPGANRFAVGAKVKLEAGDLSPQYREVQAGASYLSQNTLTLEFGLGGLERADRITVTWPDGATSTIEDVDADQTVRIDRVSGLVRDVLAPRTTIELAGIAGANGWFRSAVEATLVPVDRGSPTVSGLAGTEAALDEGAWAAHAGETLLFTEEGVREVHARSADMAGNTEPRRTAAVRIDRTAPTLDMEIHGFEGEDGWWIVEVPLVELLAADAASGVAEIRYRVDGGAWQVYDEPFAVGDGEHRIELIATDAAGNEAPIASREVRVDTAAPEVRDVEPSPGSVVVGTEVVARAGIGPVVVVAGAAGDPVRVRLDAIDATSGMARVIFLVDNEVRAVVPAGKPFEWLWDAGAEAVGLHELEIVAIDVASNLEIREIDVVIVSDGPPTAPASAPAMVAPAGRWWMALDGRVEQRRS